MDEQYQELDSRIIGTKEDLAETNNSILTFNDHVSRLENDFSLVKKEYKESQDLLAINIRKMGKDKR